MENMTEDDIQGFIQEEISKVFFKKKSAKLQKLTLSSILSRKNPYLFKAKGCDTPEELIQAVLEADSSSGEEGIFGNLLEKLAIFVCQKAYNGKKSGIPGIDLEFEKNGIRYLVSVKSGPKWSNADSYARLVDKFRSAVRVLGTSGGLTRGQIVCVEGCCYGKESAPKNSDHLKLCGQEFWLLISGDETLYKKIVSGFGHGADLIKYEQAYNEKKAALVREFKEKFCNGEGVINWDVLLEHNSGSPQRKVL